MGRVVIPKEIRRTLRIREGDPLEIFTDRDGEIILKKYSPIGEITNFAKEYTETLYRSMGHIACICDKDIVVSASGAGRKDLFDKPLSTQLEDILQKRRTFVANKREGGMVPITNDPQENMTYTSQVITPILVDGDAVGAVMLLSRDDSVSMGDTEIKLAETAAGFVGRQMES
ncbi:MAG: AbrB/MazE/SpoVT family DNA-binding domain-containing protein [Clostridiales bacterium]|nr:AbrB/MazE/SpoVT family DNA-binding domain-containing protein [Clostridiales bacterium]